MQTRHSMLINVVSMALLAPDALGTNLCVLGGGGGRQLYSHIRLRQLYVLQQQMCPMAYLKPVFNLACCVDCSAATEAVHSQAAGRPQHNAKATLKSR
jgi:hypothetical protein